MKVMVIPILFRALGRSPKVFYKYMEIRGRAETVQTTAVYRSTRKL